MRLPDNSVGPTDIQAYRDCPRRFEFGMRRHTEQGEHPEAPGPSTAYGSAIHDAIAYVEEHASSDDEAIQHAFDGWAKWLDPDDLELMREDLGVYHEREPLGVRAVAVEKELRTPLFEYEGQTIYLRGKLDRLYQRLDNPSVFVHVDYKSSRHRKSEEDVHSDTQLWAYNFLIHEEWPECEDLTQLYDQLRFGVIPTRKNEAQRAQIKDWLIRQATAILRDTELAPKPNQWCPWCPLMEACPVVEQATEFALARIATLAPAEKQGRRTVVTLDLEKFEPYVEQLDDVGAAIKVLERFDKSVKGVLKEMPAQRREKLGYRVFERTEEHFSPEALRAMHDVLGSAFYDAVGVSKSRLERTLKGDERLDTILGFAERRPGATIVTKKKN